MGMYLDNVRQLSSLDINRNSKHLSNSAKLSMMNKEELDPGVVWYSSAHPPPSYENPPPNIYIENYYNQVNSKKIITSPNQSYKHDIGLMNISKTEQVSENRSSTENSNGLRYDN